MKRKIIEDDETKRLSLVLQLRKGKTHTNNYFHLFRIANSSNRQAVNENT